MTHRKPQGTNGPLRRIADFEWASVGQYLVYISSAMELKEVSSRAVISFPLTRLGPEAVLKQKRKAAKVLEGNISALERFVGERKNELGPDELVVLRGLYVQYKCNIETVREHIRSADFYRRSVDVSLFDVAVGGEEDDLEF